MTKPTFAAIRATAAAQAEIAWWAGASLLSMRARLDAYGRWIGNATIQSTAADPTRLVRGGGPQQPQPQRVLSHSHGLGPPLARRVRGLSPEQVVDAKAVAAEAECFEPAAVRALLAALTPHLDRVRAEIDHQLCDPQKEREAEGALRAKQDAAAKTRLAKRLAEFREQWLPRLIGDGLTEEEWLVWYRTAVVGGVMES